MPDQQARPDTIDFEPFRVNLRTQELSKHGVRLRLPGQSFQVLAILLQKPGELVTREELRQALWPAETHVDFDHGVNVAVARLREVLGDSADNPRLIETLPRRGYRFIGAIDPPQAGASATPPVDDPQLAVQVNPETIASDHIERLAGSKRALRYGVAILSCAGLLVLAIFLSHRVRRGPFEPVTLRPVPFTDYPGLEYCPRFSPDGTRIAFGWTDNNQPGLPSDLNIKALGDEKVLRLTQKSPGTICGAWSPDGSRLAFFRFFGAESGLFVVSATGGAERKLHAAVGGAGASWSPDGKWIAFAAPTSPSGVWDTANPDDPSRIHLVSPETLEVREIPHPDGCLGEQDPVFSHSGDRLAYFCLLKTNDNEVGLFIQPWTGGHPSLVTRMVTGWDLPAGITWSADDQRLVVARTRVGNDGELNEVRVADGAVRKLDIGMQGSTCCPDISRNGKMLTFMLFVSRIGIWRQDLSHLKVQPSKLIASTYEDSSPQYSPDGKHVAFTSNRSGTWEIWMGDRDGDNLVRISDSNSANAGSPKWSPDSQRVAFDSRQAGRSEVYVVDVAERLPRKFRCNVSDMNTPSWSHDGKWIYVQATSQQRIFRCPAAGGEASQLSSGTGSYPLESYDGTTLFFVRRGYSEELYQLPLQSSSTESLEKRIPALHDQSLYTVTSDGIYFVPSNAPKSILYLDFVSGKVRKVTDMARPTNNGLSISPDGKSILYTQISEANANLMLVDHFE